MQTEPKKREYKTQRTARAAVVATDRVPPQALDVERTVLGSMLIDSAAVDAALETLVEECFYSEANAAIFRCIRELSEKNSPVDIVTVSEKLRGTEGGIEAIGSEAYLSELAESVVTSGNVQYYAAILKEKSTRRRLISAAAEITTECFSSDRETNEVLDAAEAKIFSIAESRVNNKFESAKDILPRVLEEMHGYAQGGVNGVPTGFIDLDNLTTGLKSGDLVIVGGRPSMGKTAFCLAIALNASIRGKVPTAVFSLEMSKSQIIQRMVCGEACVNIHTMRSGHLGKPDYDRIDTTAGNISEAPLFVDDTPGITVLELRAKARRLKAHHNLGLIIVDYLQLMTPSVRADSAQQEISQISRSLKAVARELEVPVIALSQLSRAPDQRGGKGAGDHRPQLSDLRDSGAIEQDADVVMFVYRESYYKRDDPTLEGKATIIVAKQRNGPTKDVDVAFLSKYAKFDNLADNAEEYG